MIAALSRRSKSAEKQAETEEATKTAVILPFLQALGFDVFDLDEVVPEYIADVGIKKGEKVDFAVKIDGKVAMLIEAKPIHARLGETQYSQLFRYFAVTDARLAILMNGREAWFFSDTDEPNKMDKKPFFKFDLQEHDPAQVEELSRFQKGSFAIESIIEAASNLKYMREAASYLKRQLSSPEDDFIRLVAKSIYDGSITKNVLEQVRPAITGALDELVRNRIQDKLSITFSSEPVSKDPGADAADPDIITTDSEREGFMIIRAIAAKVAAVERINLRDAKSYCAILMDDNNRKPVCRLYFNSEKNMQIGLFDADKSETKVKIDRIADIYHHAAAIEAAVNNYL
ncbi:type I restriction endonuclease [Paracoccus aurantiacus]|nr:type I restriction endonuclease [Paracoccus aurantiacus]